MNILKTNASITNKLFSISETLNSFLLPTRPMKILFSSFPGWEEDIRNGFRFTKHEIAFGQFFPENIGNYDLIVPLTLSDLKYLNTVHHLISDNPIPIPSLESVLLCENKYLLNKTLIAHGFGDFIPPMGGSLGYPYVLKKKVDECSNSVHIILDAQQEKKFSHLLTYPDYFCQKFIIGCDEYATHIIIKNKKIVCSLNVKYVFANETPIKMKSKTIFKQIVYCPYLELFTNILRTIGFEGLCCFNYKVTESRPYIIEINPRFGGSLSPLFFSFIKYLNATR